MSCLWTRSHDEKQESILNSKQEQLSDAQQQVKTTMNKKKNGLMLISELGELGQIPATHYNTESEAHKHNTELENLRIRQTQSQAKLTLNVNKLIVCVKQVCKK